MIRLIVGCGYLGGRVAERWLAAGDTVFAITRSKDRSVELRQRGLEPIVADVARPETLLQLPAADSVLYAVGFDARSGTSRRQVYVEGLGAVLDALPNETRRVIFISSTGVYGDAGGDWVDEDTPCRPTREAGRELLAAEQLLASHRLGQRAIVLRMAGMYGHERLPRQADIRAGKAILAASDSWLNLIHVDDAAEVVIAADARAKPPCTYVVSDGQPAERREFFRYLGERLAAPAVQFIEPLPDFLKSHHSGDSKRVRNAKMLSDLKVRLAYPGYRAGLTVVDR